ncbi:unknown [Clostridium sp. CAG:149]|nr:unknown [Clostridium sp. CAG:149]
MAFRRRVNGRHRIPGHAVGIPAHHRKTKLEDTCALAVVCLLVDLQGCLQAVCGRIQNILHVGIVEHIDCDIDAAVFHTVVHISHVRRASPVIVGRRMSFRHRTHDKLIGWNQGTRIDTDRIGSVLILQPVLVCLHCHSHPVLLPGQLHSQIAACLSVVINHQRRIQKKYRLLFSVPVNHNAAVLFGRLEARNL